MDADRPRVIDRRSTARGELVLRRAGDHFEVISDGSFLMDTRDGRSERELVCSAIAGRERVRLLLGGLGVGFSLEQALSEAAVAQVVVVEIEPAVVEWARGPLRDVTSRGLDDPRVELVVADLADYLTGGDDRFDAICLDVDNGPGWLVRPGNASLYRSQGLAVIERRLAPGGRLAVWAAADDAGFEQRLRERFAAVRTVRVAVPRGRDDVVYLAERTP